MSKVDHHQSINVKRRLRVRAKLHGTADRPRVSVYRSNKHIFVQAIDDVKGETLVSSSDHELGEKKTTKLEQAKAVGMLFANKAKKAKLSKFVFDRGSYRYHGRVQVVAEALREQGLQV